jgi:hypothetical protein
LGKRSWPPWWEWELKFNPHLAKRMEDRRFNEIELRRMLEGASGYRRDVVADRWIIEARHRRWPWEVIVEPLVDEHLLLVITAYPVECEAMQ